MKLDILPIGLYAENSYVLHHKKHVLLVDPGRFAQRIAEVIGKDETVDGIVLTHGHNDHTGAVDDLAEMYGCPVYIHPDDRILVDKNGYGHGYDAPIYAELTDLSGEMMIGTFPVTVYHTPGHTAGSVCVRIRGAMFTGDTLFAGDIGRTDLFSGDEMQMLESLKFLATLPHDIQIFPGHGPSSTIAQELKTNMYLMGNVR